MFTKFLNRIKPNFRSLSLYGLLFIFITLIYVNFNIKRWKEANVIDWDVTSYYGYLPAFFIHHDLKLDFTIGKEDDYKNKHQFWPEIAPNGGKVIKTTMGLAFLYTPFFLVAHTMATLKGYETDGFSEPYEKYIHLSALFYLFLGLIFFRKILLRYFSEVIAFMVLLMITMGTNLFYFTTTEAALSHAYSFSLFAIFIYLCIRWHDEQKFFWTIFIGLVGGLMVLIRPVNLLIFVFPFLYEVKSFSELKAKFLFFIRQWKHLLVIGLISFLVILPQLLYWKYVTGSFFFNSYVGERFYFGNPHILEGLFSYRKGWLLYTPMMIFAFIGMIWIYKRHRDFFWPVLVFWSINMYVLFCWWAWWYGGGFGMRPMIDSYALLALPIAAFFQFLWEIKRKILFWIFSCLAFGFIYLNLFQVMQYRYGTIHWDSMSKEAYWKSFGIIQFKDEKLKNEWIQSLKAPDYDAAREGRDEYDFNPF